MDSLNAKQEQEIDNLKFSINGLIEDYKRAYTLLNEQMQAVINHDIESLNKLIEKQVSTYETLKESENEFKEDVQKYTFSSQKGQEQSLGLILNNLDRPSKQLNALRDQLRTQVEKPETMRSKLMNLLQFAQQQNAEMFKTLWTEGNEDAAVYNNEGKKQRQAHGITINQKA